MTIQISDSLTIVSGEVLDGVGEEFRTTYLHCTFSFVAPASGLNVAQTIVPR